MTDLDNTLYDWEAFFVPAFGAMLAEVARVSGLPADAVRESFQRVYRRYRTTEYAFAIEELDALAEVDKVLSEAERRTKYASAIEAFRDVRALNLRLYPGVRETLEALRDGGILVAAHSDSLLGYVEQRLRLLGIEDLFAAVSAPRDHGEPRYRVRQSIAQPSGHPSFLQVPFDRRLRKPDPRTLGPLLAALSVQPSAAAYIGDNLSRDVLLGARAGTTTIWARYGAVHDPELRAELLKITYWTSRDVAREDRLRGEAELVRPDYIVDSFAEVVPLLLGGARPRKAERPVARS